MLAKTLTAAVVLFTGLAYGAIATAQSPTPEPPTATATAASDNTLAPATTTPLPVSEEAMAVVGYVFEDTDGDGIRSAGDRPAETILSVLVVKEGYLDGGGDGQNG